jgi:uncharacterized cupredoxin-like copper-binding protein
MNAPAPSPAVQPTDIGIARLAAISFSVLALVMSFAALVESTGDDGGSEAQAGFTTVPVSLTDFKVTPGLEVAEGGVLSVTNDGEAQHTLAVEGTDLVTPTLNAGDADTVDLGDLAVGDYVVVCTIPGHKELGMTGTMKVVAAGEEASGDTGATSADGHSGHSAMNAVQMDAAMAVRTKAFPAKTEGVGAQDLAATVLPDGTKQFELTSSEIDWEIEPGKTVKAMAYNGMVPGPTMRVAIGDKLRIVLHNEMEESTAIHFHGLRTPNAMDGVPDITQEPVRKGESFVYEFVAKGPAVGMYHSHHNAAVQVPNGLAGTILVGDLPLPAGVTLSQEIPMMLNDAGTIGYSLNGKSFPATAPIAVKPGEYVLVHYLNEGIMAHPMHLHGLEQTVIAKDGMPLQFPYKADTVNVSPGERYSVLVHADEPGVWAWHCHILPHAERSDGMFGMVTAMIVQ